MSSDPSEEKSEDSFVFRNLSPQDREIELELELSLGGYDRKRKTAQTDTSSSSSWSSGGAVLVMMSNVGEDDASTELRLGIGEPNINWVIKKKLKKSDVNHLSRLMLSKEAVDKYIVPFLDEDRVRKVKEKDPNGVAVRMYDEDTKTEHTVKLKVWGKGSPVLNDQWVAKFVRLRELKEGDEIGLFWDTCNARLCFSVLNRS